VPLTGSRPLLVRWFRGHWAASPHPSIWRVKSGRWCLQQTRTTQGSIIPTPSDQGKPPCCVALTANHTQAAHMTVNSAFWPENKHKSS